MGKHLKTEQQSDGSETSDIDDNAPDGGWGWAVCFGCFLVMFILDGTMFSFGVLLLDLLEYFGEGKAKTSWIGSCLLGWSMFMGPVVSFLLEKFSCRQVTIAGTLLSVVGFIISTFSPCVEILIITYGVIAGIGFSMSFISAIIIVGVYFNKKRAIATGIAMSGSGLGTFAYAYLTNFLLEEFDWKGTVLILTGIHLHVVICGLLFRPLQNRSRTDTRTNSPTNSNEEIPVENKKLLSIQDFDMRDHLPIDKLPFRLALSTSLLRDEFTGKPFSSHVDLRDKSKPCRHKRTKVVNQMYKKDIFYSGSLARLPRHEDDDSSSFASSKEENSEAAEETKFGFLKTLKRNVSLFKSKTFILLLLMNVTWTVQSVPLTYIPDLGVSKGLPTSQAALLISIVGFTNIIGRVLSGVITDVFKIKSIVTYTASLFTAATANFLFPWCEGFVSLSIVCGVFGLCMATTVSMRTIVIADHLGIGQLTRAFGMIALFQGITFMANAPLAGFLFEKYQSYVMPFNYAGLMYGISAIVGLSIYCLSNRKKRHMHTIIVHEPGNDGAESGSSETERVLLDNDRASQENV